MTLQMYVKTRKYLYMLVTLFSTNQYLILIDIFICMIALDITKTILCSFIDYGNHFYLLVVMAILMTYKFYRKMH